MCVKCRKSGLVGPPRRNDFLSSYLVVGWRSAARCGMGNVGGSRLSGVDMATACWVKVLVASGYSGLQRELPYFYCGLLGFPL